MKPTIELRKLRHSKSLSEETPAYTADVLVDGALFCHVSNHGTGGCDMQYPPKGMTGSQFRPLLEALDKRIGETFPPIDFYEEFHTEASKTMEPLKQNLEMVCHGLVGQADLEKTVARDLKKNVMWISDGKQWQVSLRKAKAPMEKLIPVVKTKYGVEKTLNEMPLAEAVAAILELK